jgi:GDPmannose 4,6-dehydratase
MAPNDFRSVLQTVARAAPDEIYNLAGQTSVGLSFEQPVESIESNVIGVLNLLEAIRFVERPIAFYNAGSSECFGDTGEHRRDGGDAFPAAQPLCGGQGLRAQPGGQLPRRLRHARLHRHPLQPRIAAAPRALRHAEGGARGLPHRRRQCRNAVARQPRHSSRLGLGARVRRGDVADAAAARGRRLRHRQRPHGVARAFRAQAFAHFGLDWQKHVRVDPTLLRPSDIRYGAADPSLARRVLGWQAQRQVDGVIAAMCESAKALHG